MLRLHRALVRSKLDYGCMIYSSAKPYILNALDPVYNEAICICTGAFKSSPISSLYPETGEPSLSTRGAKLTIQFFIHIQLLPDSPIFKTIHRIPLEVAPPGSFASKTYETQFNSIAIWEITINTVSNDFHHDAKADYLFLLWVSQSNLFLQCNFVRYIGQNGCLERTYSESLKILFCILMSEFLMLIE